MSRYGRIDAFGDIYLNKQGAATAIGFKFPTSAPASSFAYTFPNQLPGSLQALAVDSSGNLSYQSLGSNGTVTSVGLSMPSIFSVTGSPISTSGTLTASLNSQAANLLLASPDGAAGIPTFRSLTPNDIPLLPTTQISGFDTQVRTTRLDQLIAPTTALNLNSQRLIGVADPTSSSDAATKNYVDSLIATGNNKGTARAATTAALAITSATTTAITMSGGMPAAIDGVTLAAGDIVLVKDQSGGTATGAAANGLYVYASGTTWNRATNADLSAEVQPGLFVFISEGTVNGDNGYTLTTNAPIVLGTTQLSFTQTSGAGQITAGNGLTKTGNQLDVGGTTNRITVNADTIDIASTYIGQNSIITLGTITTGTWQGTTIALTNGGTGATTAAGARTNLGAPGVYRTAFTSGNLVGGILTVTHNLGQQVVKVQVSDNSNKLVIPDEVTLTSASSCTIDFTSYGAITGTWNVICVG